MDQFHGREDANWVRTPGVAMEVFQAQAFSYRFYSHSHPYAEALVKRLIAGSVAKLQAADTDTGIEEEEIFTKDRYHPSDLVVRSPKKKFDFDSDGAYSVYNWELFYHIPLAIAVHLGKNQRFEEAQQWFHYIFDPTDDSDGLTPQRFWQVRPFQTTDVEQIEKLLVNLSSRDDLDLRAATINSIGAWKDAPFRPHVVARYRPSAYMFKTVMAYLDNLIAWGDSLFRQDTGETINEAAQLYVLAANILGPGPQAVPKRGDVEAQTYEQVRAGLDAFGNVIRSIEAEIPADSTPHPNRAADNERLAMISSLANTLYFCVPRNDKLLSYWDTVADRLFKIRNSLNLQGTFRQLPLFEPPIDPALLARATAAGVDVAAIVSGVNQPLPLVRFQILLQKATEICQEVKSLGNNLLAAIEKQDNEALAILRAAHERSILEIAETVKYSQWQEAIKTREGLEKSLSNAGQRYTYYERLLGKLGSQIKIPPLETLDSAGLETMKFEAKEPELDPREITVDIAPGGPGTVGSLSAGLLGAADITGGKKVSSYEFAELNRLEEARLLQTVSAILETQASGLSLVPQFNAHATPIGVGVATGFGGVQLSQMASMLASVARSTADELSYRANKSAKIGAYARREQDWEVQSNLAAGEINQILKQLRAAEIREFIAQREWTNHKTQIAQAKEIETFLTDERVGKKTSQAFYTWMKRDLKGLYGQAFEFAFDIARKAERALQHELGNPELSFLQFGYLAGKEGLLAGEKLYLDIKRIEMAYQDLNQREYELTKHVSLLQIDPLSLLQLRATGRCTVALPESLFDMDGPGHFFRRIKTVAVSIPCVTGPYSSVNCTLTLLKSSIRTTQILRAGLYVREDAEDDRFSDYFGSLQSIVTSSAQNDSGMFESNLHDERYLPFENSGVISEWQLELPADPSTGDPRQFDYSTISDVILHLRYTAREGGVPLRNQAMAALKTAINAAQAAGSVRLFSVRHEFPTEWASFKNSTGNRLSLRLEGRHYPFWVPAGFDPRLVTVIASARLEVTYVAGASQNHATLSETVGALYRGDFDRSKPLPPGKGAVDLTFNDNSVTEIWLAATWGM